MPQVDEIAKSGEGFGLKSVLDSGLDLLSRQVQLEFRRYLRTVLPLDNFIFWVEASLTDPSAVINSTGTNPALGQANGGINTAAPGQPRVLQEPPVLFDLPSSPIGEFETGSGVAGGMPGTQPGSAAILQVSGSLHYATDKRQNEDETIAVNRVVFTSEKPVDFLNEVGPTQIFIAEVDGIRFAFSRRENYFAEADLYHYVGDAIYPAMESQIIDADRGIDIESLVVSNSLPFWLQLGNLVPVFPSYAVPDNQPPPYAAIHIEPGDTEALAAQPSLDRSTSSHWQLAADRVRVTLYGLRNDAAMDFYDAVMAIFYNNNQMGLMSTPVVRDEKRTQVELGILAMKKTLDFRVSYYQFAARDFARQLIKLALVNYTFPATDSRI
jgi:hypothetical protein